MTELSVEEEQWLKVFAKYNPFFDDLLRYFSKNGFLTEKQYEYLEKEIDRAEEDGNNILDKDDFRFLKEQAEENEDLREILEIYEEDGFLEDFAFNKFIDIKLELNPDFKKREISSTKSENELQRKKIKEYFYSISKKICPHCSSRCPSHMKICLNCGEPLSDVEDHSRQFTPDASQKKHDEGTPNNYNIKKINLEKIEEFLNEEFLAKDPISNYLTYVLKLENNKWWIGKTRLILKTIEDLKRGKGNKWIIDNPIVSIEKLIFLTNPASLTLEYMKKYGWENVQGSSWYENQLDKYIPVKILNYVNEQKKLKPNDDISVEDDEKYLVYVLRLENDKWWIGKTTNIKRTLKKIRNGKGSPWTVINRLIKLEELRENTDLKEVTLEYMRNYGWENVRGYAWSQWNMKNPPKELRLK